MACKPGEMHEVDKALYELTVKQRDLAWRVQERLATKLADAEDIIRRFAVGKRPDGTYNYSREAAEQQCNEYLDKYGEA